MCKETDLYGHNYYYGSCTVCNRSQESLSVPRPETNLNDLISRKPKTLFGEIHDYFPSIPEWKLGAWIKWLGKEFMVEALSTAKHDFEGTMQIQWFQNECKRVLRKMYGTETPWRETKTVKLTEV